MRKKRASFTMKNWTEDEDTVLIDMYADPTVKLKDIQQALNRSSASISGRASVLKIKKMTYGMVEVPEGTKICRKCGIIKPTGEFFNNKSKDDGLDCWCKECSKVAANEYLVKQAQKKVDADLELKQNYIKANEGRLFKCTKCNGDFDIHHYAVVKKNNRYVKQSICKMCKNAETKRWKYNKIKELGHI